MSVYTLLVAGSFFPAFSVSLMAALYANNCSPLYFPSTYSRISLSGFTLSLIPCSSITSFRSWLSVTLKFLSSNSGASSAVSEDSWTEIVLRKSLSSLLNSVRSQASACSLEEILPSVNQDILLPK